MKQPQNNSVRSAALALCISPEVLESHLDVMRTETELLKTKKPQDTVPYEAYRELFQKYSYLIDEASAQRVRIASLEKRLGQYESMNQ